MHLKRTSTFFIFSSAQCPGFSSRHLNGFLYSFHKKTVHKSDCSDLCTACIRSPFTRVFVSYSRFVQLLLEKFLQFLSQSLTSQIFTYHHTVCINQIHSRYKFHLIECSDSCLIQKVRPGKPLFFQSFLPISLLLIDRNTYNLKTFFAILCIQLLQVRNLFPTRVAPGSPKINQYIFFSLSQCGKGYFLS